MSDIRDFASSGSRPPKLQGEKSQVPTSLEVVAKIKYYAKSTAPTDLETLDRLSHMLEAYASYGAKLLRLGCGTDSSTIYDISTTPFHPKSLHQSPSPASNPMHPFLLRLSLDDSSTGKTTSSCAIPLGRVLLNKVPTHWIIFLSNKRVFGLRSDSIPQEEVDLCMVDHGTNGLGECTCGWRTDKYRDVFGEDEDLMAVYLGDVDFLVGAQMGEMFELEWKPFKRVSGWGTSLVDKE